MNAVFKETNDDILFVFLNLLTIIYLFHFPTGLLISPSLSWWNYCDNGAAPSLKLSQFHHLHCQTQTKTKNKSSSSYSTIARSVTPQTFLLPEVLVRDLSMQQLLRYSRSIRFFAIIFHPFLVFIAPRSVSRAASVQCILIKEFCEAIVLKRVVYECREEQRIISLISPRDWNKINSKCW